MSQLLQEATRSQETSPSFNGHSFASSGYAGQNFLPSTPYSTGMPEGRRARQSTGSSSVRPIAPEKPIVARSVDNPLADLLSDELFHTLRDNDLLNEKALRDFMIRQQFKRIKEQTNMRTMEAMAEIQRLYPYLQLDTIRKIVYRVYPTSGKKPML
jgi:hypothetical protein